MRLGRLVKHLWFVLVMKGTWVLPDVRPVLRLRGFLARPCFSRCGRNLQLSSDVQINFCNGMGVGANVVIAHGCWINAQGGVSLADEVMLGPYTVIASGNHSMVQGSYRFGEPVRAPVRIGFGSWVGAGVKVMPGVRVGRSACCAAGAVVTRDVPDGALVGGVPARVIRGGAPGGGSEDG